MTDIAILTKLIEPEAQALGLALVRVAMFGGKSDPTLQVMAERLEVSSPGIDRPLTRLADFADWAGFDARIRLAAPLDGRKQFDARLERVEDDTVTVYAERVGLFAIPYAAIASAKLKLTDALIKATAPLSAEGADRIIEVAPANGADMLSQEG